MNVKDEIEKRAEQTELKKNADQKEIKLTKGMNVKDMIQVLEPEIKRALPSVLTPERFTRMALSAINNTPKLAECSQMSFLAALMNAAQLGLEPNTPLGQAYLIPFLNKGKLECQFQVGYKGMIELVYRNPLVQTIQAHAVYENDQFDYELGLDAKLKHKPCLEERGDLLLFYAVFKLTNGGYGFEVMSKQDMDVHANRYAKGISSSFSPWKTNYEEMAKKTIIKKVLKYAPIRTDFLKAVSLDETVKTELSVDMSEVKNETIIDMEEYEDKKNEL